VGVELGKQLANKILPELKDEKESTSTMLRQWFDQYLQRIQEMIQEITETFGRS